MSCLAWREPKGMTPSHPTTRCISRKRPMARVRVPHQSGPRRGGSPTGLRGRRGARARAGAGCPGGGRGRGVCPGLLGSSWKRSCWGPGQTPRPKRQGGQTAPGAHELEHSPCWGAAEFQGCLTHIGKLEVEGYIVCVSSAFFASHPPPLGGNDILGAWLPLPHVMHPPGAPWTVDTGLILPTHFSPGLFWG